jgi:hypothetical protein
MATPQPSPEDLIHRIHNLLAVIQTQAEVARVLGTPEAARAALALIEEAAQRTGAEVRRFRPGGAGRDRA